MSRSMIKRGAPARRGDGYRRSGREVRGRREAPHLESLNAQQREAATALEGPLLVLAGAGTGKTKLLVARIIELMRSRTTKSWRILALTFTRDAADEMRSRLAEEIGSERAERVWMGTFHAICLRLLAERPGLAGLEKGFKVIDEAESRRFVRLSMEAMGVSGADDRDIVRLIAGALSRIKDDCVPPEADAIEMWFQRQDERGEGPSEALQAAAAIYPAYQEQLRDANVADFADLLLWVTEGMRRDEAYRREVARRWSHILVDEYQDTNTGQDAFIELLCRDHRNIMVVGDDSQSLYAWRGAVVENILTFPDRWPGCRMVRLEINYRCTPVILDSANAVIAHNLRRFEKTLRPDPSRRGRGDPVRVVRADSLDVAADWLVNDVRVQLASDRTCGAFVLYRANWLSRVVEEACITYGLHYCLVGDVGFWQRMEILDALALVRLMDDPSDVDAFERIANVPARGLGEGARQRIRDAAGEGGDLLHAGLTLAEARGLRTDQAQGARELAGLAESWRAPCREDEAQLTEGARFAGRVQELLEASGYLDHWRVSDDPRSDERLDNLAELTAVAATGGGLDALLDRAARAAEAEQDDAAVRLMTIHASKGLEEDLAYLFGVNEAVLPSRQAAERERFDGGRAVEEERNGMYVGMTRARDRLTILTATDQPSRFVGELPEDEATVRHLDARSQRRRRGVTPGRRDIEQARQLAGRLRLPLPDAVLVDAALLAHWKEEAALYPEPENRRRSLSGDMRNSPPDDMRKGPPFDTEG